MNRKPTASVTPTCIYCSAQDLNREHHLPAGLGSFENYEFLDDHLCPSCNRACGILDEQLCRSGPEALFRRFLGIQGRKSHEKTNSFYRGGAGGSALEMLATNQNTGQNVLVELLGDTEARELRCAQLIGDDDIVRIIRITDGMTPAEFRRVFDSFGIKRFKEGLFYAAPEEQEWIESLIATLKWERKGPWVRPAAPITYGPSVVKFTLTSRYFRAIAKIGFHYFLTKMPHLRGDEPCFSGIRQFIMNNRCPVEECRRFVSYFPEHIAFQLQSGARLAGWGHFLAAESNYHELIARVELFAGPEKRPLSYTVKLGTNPSRLDYREAYADFFEYFKKEHRAQYDGAVSPLSTMAASPRIVIPLLNPLALIGFRL
jgi:hypothetical protein